MRRLLIILFFLIISVLIGVEIMRHPGYLLLVFSPWMVQMPIWLAILGLILTFILFYILIDSIDRMQLLWYRLKTWWRFRREQQLYSKTQLGLAALIEGRWKKSERLLLAGIDQTSEPLINYLGSARAAQEQNALERRDSYIQKAYEVAPSAELAIGLTQAQLEISQNQLEQAAATLEHLRKQSPYHPRVLRLQEKVYRSLGDWQSLLNLLPYYRKAKVLSAMEQEKLEQEVYCQVFQSVSFANAEEVRAIYYSIPRYLRKKPDIVSEYVKALLRFNDTTKEVEDLIKKVLNSSYHPELVRIYGNLPFNNLNKQLVVVGAWLKQYGPQPELLLLLGKMCVRVQLWGKAKDYFDKCLALGPNPEASLEYGKLLERLDQHDDALQKYRDGLRYCGVEDRVLLEQTITQERKETGLRPALSAQSRIEQG